MSFDFNFFWILFFIGVTILLFLLHNLVGLNLFSTHDRQVIEDFLKKYPDVTPDYMAKGLRMQNIENNQEIHDLNKKVDKLFELLADDEGRRNE